MSMKEVGTTSIIVSVKCPDSDSDGAEVESRGIHIGRTILNISLLSISIPNTEYNVDVGMSDKVRFARDGKTFTSTISPGQYDLKSLPVTLEAVMNKSDPEGKYTVHYSSTSKRLSVTSESSFHFSWGSIDDILSACSLMGMDEDDSEDARIHTGIKSPQIWKHLDMMIALGFSDGGEWTTTYFPVTLDPEKDVTVRSYQGYTTSLLCTFPKKMRIYLVDSSQNPLEDTDGWNIVFLMNISGKDTDYEDDSKEKESEDIDKSFAGEKQKDKDIIGEVEKDDLKGKKSENSNILFRRGS